MHKPKLDEKLRVHALTWNSQVNGPGSRHVVHTQGCNLACPGCFNSATHVDEGGELYDSDQLATLLLSRPSDGISISGGEPFQQAPQLLALLKALRDKSPNLSILLFSGYRLEEIRARVFGSEICSHLDVLIDGRFEIKGLAGEGLRGSQNQQLHLFSQRHQLQEFADRNTEIIIQTDGSIVMTGFPHGKIVGALRNMG